MSYVVTEKCVDCKFTSCVSVCPVDAFHELPDGVQIGAVLDRNGLRPSRYYVTSDDRVILASEVGVLSSIPSSKVVRKGRLEPGRMFLVDMEQGRIIEDAELKANIASQAPYGEWINQSIISEDSLPHNTQSIEDNNETLLCLSLIHI